MSGGNSELTWYFLSVGSKAVVMVSGIGLGNLLFSKLCQRIRKREKRSTYLGIFIDLTIRTTAGSGSDSIFRNLRKCMYV